MLAHCCIHVSSPPPGSTALPEEPFSDVPENYVHSRFKYAAISALPT